MRTPRSVSCATKSPRTGENSGVLAQTRWPGGFVCPECGHGKAWQLDTKAWTYECAQCRRQTSVTAGTVMRGSKLSLTVWFWGAYLMATHSNGMSARQLWRHYGQHNLDLVY